MLQAIKRELLLRKSELKVPVDTIYFGGGTPSLLNKEELNSIISTVYTCYQIGDSPEITLEANPDDLTAEKIKMLANSPVNRLSIGVQSFSEKDLRLINRAHNADEAKRSIALAKNYFKNISIDLIYGIPGLNDDQWYENLMTTFDFGVVHISSYALTVEPKTALSYFIEKGKYLPVSESQAERQFKLLQKESADRGYLQYEISNFAKSGYYSKHNSSYWKGIPYLGIGPSAHSFNGMRRSWNIANNHKYLAGIAKGELPSDGEILSKEDRINELIMTGLRTNWGLSLIDIRKNFGEEVSQKILKRAQKYIEKDLLSFSKGHLILLNKGLFLADGIAADLFIIKDGTD